MPEKKNQLQTERRTRSRRVRKPKKSQIPYALLLSIVFVGIGFLFAANQERLAIFWMFGLGFGYVLQRARFCFTAGFRDIWITGNTSVTRALLVAFGLATLGVTAIKYQSTLGDVEQSLAMSGVNAIGWPLAIGAIVFGIGMVIAGGCASGTLMRVGEGFTQQLIVLIFFVIGSFIGGIHTPFFNEVNENAPRIFLPDIFGWVGALAVQGLIILLVYIAAVKWQKKKIGTIE